MLAGQAIGNSVMDLTASIGVKSSINSESSVANTKDSVSFSKLLSKTTYERNAKDVKVSEKPKTLDVFSSKPLEVTEKTAKEQSNQVTSEQLSKCGTESKVDDSSIADTVATVILEVKESIMETLEVTEEELLNMMEMLGLNMVDLLNPETLKLLVLNQAGTTEPLMLLTQDGLGWQLNQLLSKLNDVMKEANLSTKDVTKLCNNPTEFDKLISLLDEATTMPQQEIVQLQEEVQTEGVKEAKQSEEESRISFTVVNEESGSEHATNLSTSLSDSASNHENQQAGYKTDATIANQFIDQLVNASSIVNESNFSESLTEIHNIREVANQIINQIKLTIRPTQTSMEFTLNPENLGRVGLNITSKDGILTASFTTQNEIAKEAIESQMHILRDSLSNQGIKVDAIEVTVSDFGFQQESKMSQEGNQQNDSSSSNKRVFRMDSVDDVFEDQTENIVDPIFIDSGSNIDYSA